MMRTSTAALVLGVLFSPVAAAGQEPPMWRCSRPPMPLRIVDSEANQRPPCTEWVQIRGVKLTVLRDSLESHRFPAANQFLAEASEAGMIEYPGAAEGAPVPTTELYDNPSEYGFEVSDVEDAPLGSLVVYNGLGGILVESRTSTDAEWTREVLYPSAARGFQLALANPAIPGKLPPKVLVREAQNEPREQ